MYCSENMCGGILETGSATEYVAHWTFSKCPTTKEKKINCTYCFLPSTDAACPRKVCKYVVVGKRGYKGCFIYLGVALMARLLPDLSCCIAEAPWSFASCITVCPLCSTLQLPFFHRWWSLINVLQGLLLENPTLDRTESSKGPRKWQLSKYTHSIVSDGDKYHEDIWGWGMKNLGMRPWPMVREEGLL